MVPGLLAHPDWSTPAPTVIWMHGRTVSKELDSGRYLRWIRAGIAACAIDLPGHGERLDERLHDPRNSPELISTMVSEIDGVVRALAHPQFKGVFDPSRLAIGGMSAGGMAALRRLCDEHHFRCAAVEGAAGNMGLLYGDLSRPGAVGHQAERIATIEPMTRLNTWRPIPLLALHSEADQVVPLACIRTFIEALASRFGSEGSMATLRTWPQTGAPFEHNGFGRVGNDAKNAQLEFLSKHLLEK